MKRTLWTALCFAVLAAFAGCSGPPDDAADRSSDGTVSEPATSGTVTLIAGDPSRGGYDFEAQAFRGLTGGDFYFVGGAFWANNTGQRGVVGLGACSSVNDVSTIPDSGYTLFGVGAQVGSCYVALTQNDTRDDIVFRVTSLDATTVTLAWKLIKSGTFGATLLAEDPSRAGYDFAARAYHGASGGDLYLSGSAFWANNVGQKGVVSLGPCDSIASVKAIPTSGYSSFGVGAIAGNCYVALSHADNYHSAIIRVDAADTTSATLTWKLVSALGVSSASVSGAATARCTAVNRGIPNVSTKNNQLKVTFTASKFGLTATRVVTTTAITSGNSKTVSASFATGGTSGNPNLPNLGGFKIDCTAEITGPIPSGSTSPNWTPAIAPVQSLCAGSLDLTNDVECWLDLHPEISQYVNWESIDYIVDHRSPTGKRAYGVSNHAWAEWLDWQHSDLRALFAYYVDVLGPGPHTLSDPLPLPYPDGVMANLQTLEDSEYPYTIVSDQDAWGTYAHYLAMSLAVELTHNVPWSITTYDGASLSSLLDSRHTFVAVAPGGTFGDDLQLIHPTVTGYAVVSNNYDPLNGEFAPGGAWAMPNWDPNIARNFVNAFIGTTRLATIGNVLEWAKRLQHAHLYTDLTGSYSTIWHYRGAAPVNRTLTATASTQPGDPPEPYHWTAGCHGTSEVLQTVLRVVNIPVDENNIVGHSATHFMTEGLYLSHGDDLYIGFDKSGLPDFPQSSSLLIDSATFDAWFKWGDANANVGRGTVEANLKNLSGWFLDDYCNDVRNGVTDHNQSMLLGRFGLFSSFYPVSYLENLPPVPGQSNSLWDRLAQRAAANGGCSFPDPPDNVESKLINEWLQDEAIEPASERLGLEL